METKDFLNKNFSLNRRVVYIENNLLNRGKVLAISVSGNLKVQNEITKEIVVVKECTKNVYAYVEDIDIKEAFKDFNIIDSSEQMTERDFIRQTSEIKDVAGDQVLPGDKVLMIHKGYLQLGRTTEINKKDKSIYISIPDETLPVKISNKDSQFLLITKDYYIKSK